VVKVAESVTWSVAVTPVCLLGLGFAGYAPSAWFNGVWVPIPISTAVLLVLMQWYA
jgi:hypothetical protein